MKPSLHRALPLLLALTAQPAFAGFDMDYPVVEKGAFSAGYTGVRTGDDSGSAANNAQDHELAVNYGFTDNFAASLVFQGARDMENSFHSTGYGANAQYEFTNQEDKWWLSSGIFGEYVHTPRDGEADAMEFKILLERTQGPVTITANLTADRDTGEGREHGVALESAVVALYDANPHFNPGIEWLAGWGNTAGELDSDHYLGPVVSGSIASFETAGHESEITYNVGYFWGLTDNTADDGILLQLNYGTSF